MRVKLGEIAVLINGDRGKNYPSQADIIKDGEIPFVNAGHLTGSEIDFDEMNYISREKYDSLNAGKFYKGDILYCLRGSLGKKALVRETVEGAIASSLVIIRANEKTVDREYLMFALESSSILEQLNKANNGSSQPNLSAACVREYEIDLPEKEMQIEIVNTLLRVRKIIDDRKQQLTKLDELVKARFVEMFGDPIENPYGWEQTTLKNVAIGKLSYGSGASACEYDGNIRYVRITDIDSSGRLNNDVVSPSMVEEKYILNDGDILFARSGATVGKSYRYRECDGKCLYAGYLIRLVPNIELVLPDYVFYYTKTSYYERFIASNMKVVAQPNINAQQYGDLTICIPPMELQKDFLSFVEQVDKSKIAVQKALDEAQTLFDSLMQQYFG